MELSCWAAQRRSGLVCVSRAGRAVAHIGERQVAVIEMNGCDLVEHLTKRTNGRDQVAEHIVGLAWIIKSAGRVCESAHRLAGCVSSGDGSGIVVMSPPRRLNSPRRCASFTHRSRSSRPPPPHLDDVVRGLCLDHDLRLFPFPGLTGADGLGHVEQIPQPFAGGRDSAGANSPGSPADQYVVGMKDRSPIAA